MYASLLNPKHFQSSPARRRVRAVTDCMDDMVVAGFDWFGNGTHDSMKPRCVA